MNEVKGYKVFNPDWTCSPNGKPFQYAVGETFEEDVKLSVCGHGFHFCKRPQDCFNYYSFNPDNKVAEILALGDVREDGDKCCTNKIQIVREIEWQEVLTLVNTGKSCTGLCNSGNRNSGNCNSGNCNSGNWNSGNRNSGNRNSGNCNSGNRNSGNCNSGDWNSGNRNSGNWNSGDWNKASCSVGCFNTEDRPLFFFDKPCDWTYKQWLNSDARYLLNQIDFRPADWIWENEMSDSEKEAYPDYKTTGGYLKIRDNSDCCIEWWKGLSNKQKDIIKALPNFDAHKFFLITGIQS